MEEKELFDIIDKLRARQAIDVFVRAGKAHIDNIFKDKWPDPNEAVMQIHAGIRLINDYARDKYKFTLIWQPENVSDLVKKLKDGDEIFKVLVYSAEALINQIKAGDTPPGLYSKALEIIEKAAVSKGLIDAVHSKPVLAERKKDASDVKMAKPRSRKEFPPKWMQEDKNIAALFALFKDIPMILAFLFERTKRYNEVKMKEMNKFATAPRHSIFIKGKEHPCLFAAFVSDKFLYEEIEADLGIKPTWSRKIVTSLAEVGLIKNIGKKGKAQLYADGYYAPVKKAEKSFVVKYSFMKDSESTREAFNKLPGVLRKKY